MKVRIAVAVDDNEGQWWAAGESFHEGAQSEGYARQFLAEEGHEPTRIVWVEADIPAPDTITGRVEESDGDR